MKKRIMLVVLLFLITILNGCKLYTIVPIEEDKGEGLVADQSDKDFDSDVYAKEIWPQIEEYTVSNAAKIEDVVSMFISDKQECIDQYCLSEVGEADLARFLVSGKVMILSVDRESKVGRMEIDITPYDGIADAIVQVGPVYKKNAVRDSMPFIIFEDFMNQLAFGEAGKAINKYIDENVVIPSSLDNKVGSEVYIFGVFEDGEEIIITPVRISETQ